MLHLSSIEPVFNFFPLTLSWLKSADAPRGKVRLNSANKTDRLHRNVNTRYFQAKLQQVSDERVFHYQMTAKEPVK